ncbi:hypothetical protein OHA21_29675 [Actinoplanes sp. NBC_00393]|uniref:hypothetical protein n=1 Tax=Actinoplanes sp. NBC_00393 TaxID=2975953 RepID=UPI002E1AB0F5
MTFDAATALSRADDFDPWRFIRDFTTAWRIPLGPDDGLPAAEIEAAEDRLGVRIPGALRQAYLLFGRRTDLTSQYGTLFAPGELMFDAENQMLVFRADHQGVAHYGVPAGPDDDPPVLILLDMAEKAPEKWEPFVDRLSSGLIEMIFVELAESDDRADGRELDSASERDQLVEGLTPAAVPQYRIGDDYGQWYAGADVIVRIVDDAWVSVLARTGDALDDFRQRHPGDWVNE